MILFKLYSFLFDKVGFLYKKTGFHNVFTSLTRKKADFEAICLDKIKNELEKELGSISFDFICFAVGLLLGDGFITKTIPKYTNSCLKVGQALHNDFFLKHIVDSITKFNLNPKTISTSKKEADGLPKILSNFDRRTNKTYFIRYAYTKNMKILNVMRLWWYDNGLKHVPQNIGPYLTPYAIALWYMSDGYLVNNTNARFGTDSFSYEDVVFLCKLLKEKYDWDTKIMTNISNGQKQYRILIEKQSMPSFVKTVKPFCLPGAFYKFPSE